MQAPSRSLLQAEFQAAVEAAIARSVLGALPAPTLEELLRGAVRLDIPARSVAHRGDDVPKAGLVITGLFRQFLVHPDGREMTLRYGPIGTLAGAIIAVTGPTPTWVQAVIDTTVLMIDIERLREVAQRDAAVAWALANEMGRAHRLLLQVVAESAFGSVRQRIARHLLDLAMSEARLGTRGASLAVHVTHQELADAIASVREVVSRALRELRDDGLVVSHSGAVVILDPVRLAAEAHLD